MGQLQSLFGNSAKWLSIISWMAISLAIAGAILPFTFIIHSGFVSDNSVKSIKGLIEIWGDSRHLQAAINSFILALIVSIVLTMASTFTALVFKWCYLTGNRFIYGLSIIPLLIPDYVFGVVGRVLFDPSIGIFADWVPQSLLLNRFSALLSVAVVTILKWLPVMIVVADSSILAMGQDVLYQARMDYKSFLKAAHFVYIPQMKEVLLIIASLGFLIGFRQHELAYELTSSGAGFMAETWSYWNYRVMFEFTDLAQAAIESLLIIIILTIPIQMVRKQAQNLSAHDF